MHRRPSSWNNLFVKLGSVRSRRNLKEQLVAKARKLRIEKCEERRVLTTCTVNVEYDASAPFDFGDNDVTLREAVALAEQNDGLDTILFDSTVFGTSGTIELEFGELDITDAVTIDGGNQNITIDAGNGTDGEFGTEDGHRIFDVNMSSGDTMTLIGFTLTGGDTSETFQNGGATARSE